jgi:hypothetical protein
MSRSSMSLITQRNPGGVKAESVLRIADTSLALIGTARKAVFRDF